MKKILLIFLLVCGISLAGCSKERQLSQDELFEKKQECLKYKDQSEKKSYELSHIGATDTKFLTIFYSPIKNSCLYAWHARNSDKNFSDTSNWSFEYYQINDVFTNEKIRAWTNYLTGHLWWFGGWLESVYNNEIKKLQWE